MMKKLLLIFAVILLLALGGTSISYAALSFVQATSSYSAAAVGSITIKPVTASGNLLVVVEGAGAIASTTTPTDSAGNTYTIVASSSRGVNDAETMWASPNAGAVSNIVCHYFGTPTNDSCKMFEISGAALSAPIDATSTMATTTSVTQANSGAITTFNANDILIFAPRAGANQTTWTQQAGYTLPANSTDTRIAMSYLIISTTTSTATTSMTYGTAAGYASIFAAFKAAPAATSAPFSGTARNIVRSSFIARSACIFR